MRRPIDTLARISTIACFGLLACFPAIATELSGIVGLAAGTGHTCAIDTAGGVLCWGNNHRGQLGDGSNSIRTRPTGVIGLASGVASLAAGTDHTCALTTAGGVKCWGYEGFGGFHGSHSYISFTPADVTGVTGARAITAAGSRSCLLTSGGGVQCWGDIHSNSAAVRLTPVPVPGLDSGIVAIAQGIWHICALTAAGGVKCQGDNSIGQLGNNSTDGSTTAVDVSGLSSGVIAITAGDHHTCAVLASGAAKCWGDNRYGQLGDGSKVARLVPVDVAGLGTGVAAIAAAETHTCARTIAGGAQCWGRNASGQLGDGTTTERLMPANVTGLAMGVVAIVAGGPHTCALTDAGGVKCWGDDTNDVLGDNPENFRLAPVDVIGLGSGIAAVVTGEYHACALTAAGGVKCWGENTGGKLGNDSLVTSQSAVAVDVTGLASGVSALTLGQEHTCAVTATGGVKCWGLNYQRQLGNDASDYSATPVDVNGLGGGATALAAGFSHTCALTGAGGVKCWGGNEFGQVGNGSRVSSAAPVNVTGLESGVIAIAGGDYHSCALTVAGGIKCWGSNLFGQLGDGSIIDRSAPVEVSGLSSGIVAIAAGDSHTCALSATGGVKCWGYNATGQLGDNSLTPRTVPVDVAGMTSGVAAVSAGGAHTCAVTASGAALCWGSNRSAALGTGTFVQSLVPTGVSGLASGVLRIAAGEEHSCALTANGGVKCWGNTALGQLGDGSGAIRMAPAAVVTADTLSVGPPNEVPGAPYLYAARAGDRSVTLVFVPPDGNGSELEGYEARCSAPGQPAVGTNVTILAGRVTDVDVANMINGVTYSCSVAARNATGTGPPSLAISVTPAPSVVEFHNGILDHYFVTADANEAAAIDGGAAGPGWTRTGGRFKSGGSAAVCRFYGSVSPGPNSHFYTVDPTECATLKQLQATTPATEKRWNFESLDFLSTPPVIAPGALDDAGTCPAGTLPVYRAYNNGFARGVDSNHRLTADHAAYLATVALGWAAEGVRMCAPE